MVGISGMRNQHWKKGSKRSTIISEEVAETTEMVVPPPRLLQQLQMGKPGKRGGAGAAAPSPPVVSQPPNPKQQVITIRDSGTGSDVNLVINSSSGRKNDKMSDKFRVPGFPYNGQMEHWIILLGRNLIADGGRADYLEIDWIS